MKKLILLAFSMMFAVITFAAHAVDVIITTDAQKINAKILEVSQTEIKYKEANNQNGPTFTLATDAISSVIYANGKVAVFNNEPKAAPAKDANDYDVAILKTDGEIVRGTVIRMSDNEVTYEANGVRNTLQANQLDQVVTTYGIAKYYRLKPAYAPVFGANPKKENVSDEEGRSATWAPRYGGYLEFGGYVGRNNQVTMGGLAFDFVNGCRFNDYAFAGIGFGMYNGLCNPGSNGVLYEMGIPIYVDLRVMYPTKSGVSPYFGVAVGPKINIFNRYQGVTEVHAQAIAFYKMNFGIEVKHFTFGIGYQMEGKGGDYGYYRHHFDLRFGARLGK